MNISFKRDVVSRFSVLFSVHGRNWGRAAGFMFTCVSDAIKI